VTFKHKLSRRLAQLRDARLYAALGGGLILAACEQQPSALGPDFGVLSISLTPRSDTLLVGDSMRLTATVVMNNNQTPRALTWTSGMSAMASVSQAGTVHGLHAGSGFIVASSGNKKDSAAVTVVSQTPPPPVPVALVAVSPASSTVRIGAAKQLTATPEDGSGTPLAGRTITWASNNAGVATVSASGLVTSVGVGAATITATSEGVSGTAAVTVATVPVASVTVSPATVSLVVGAAAQLSATTKDSAGNVLTGRTITWASSNMAVATVSATGVLSGIAAGSATITATSEGQSATATVTVSSVPVASVIVSPATAGVLVGATTQLSATTKDSGGNILTGRAITWASSNTAVATVSGSGLVTGKAVGTATITATSEGKSATAAVTVSNVPVASVTVNPATATVLVGATTQLSATTKDSAGAVLTGRTIAWASSNAAVATVSGSGLVTGQTAGSATVTATSEGKNGTAAITITAPVANPATVTDLAVASVTASAATLTFSDVSDGTGQPASYFLRYAAGTISWGSATELPAIAGGAIGTKQSVTVPGLTAGTAYQFQVVAYRGTPPNAVFGGLSNVASGTTSASTAPVASVTLSPASASVAVGTTQQFTATLKDAAGNVLTGRTVTWTSSNTVLALVSGGGLVTGVAAGTVTITAASEGQSGSAALTITVTGGGGLVFQSDWSTATGATAAAVTDGGKWDTWDDFGNGQLLSVVSGVGAPGGRNALRVLQRGVSYAADVIKHGFVPVSTDFYVRFYMRNDDTSPPGDHTVEPGLFAASWNNLIYVRKTSSASAWQEIIGTENAGYPVDYWHLRTSLAPGVWYRFEFWVHFVDATHVQPHVRVYDASGTLLYGDADFQQSDYGNTPAWNGSSTWTLASFAAAGYSVPVTPTELVNFVLANNGQLSAPDTGLPWYFAGVELRTDGWVGP